MAQKLKIRLAVHIYPVATMKRSVFLMAHLFSLLNPRLLIFSYTLYVLKPLNHTFSKNPQIQNLIEKHHELSKTKEILFCWLPSHVGIKGNEAADVKAKASLDLEISNFKLPCTDFKHFYQQVHLIQMAAVMGQSDIQ